mgnify:CR=1 FL=1
MSMHLDENLPAVVYGDVSAVRQTLTNLLNNAIKYSKDSEHPVIEIGYGPGEIFHKFYVKDNGVGIAHSDLDKIFQRFYQVEGMEDKGTGIGLNLVKELVEVLVRPGSPTACANEACEKP